ncbi:MAG: cytochrome c [Bacteroidota bacterium]
MKNLSLSLLYQLNALSVLLLVLVFAAASFSFNSDAAEKDPESELVVKSEKEELSPVELHGKALFRSHCANCHNKDMKSLMTGPALAGTTDRWANYPKEDLYDWIRNSQKMINEKHPKAVELWKQFKVQMTSFEWMSDKDIDAILAYIDKVS